MNNILFTKVTYYRNIKNYKFTPKLEKAKAEEIVNILQQTIPNLSKMEVVNIDEKVKRCFIQNNLITSNYPYVFVDKDCKTAINLFKDEHLCVSSSAYGYNKECFKQAKNLVTELDNKINMSYNDRYGYLMSDLTHLGCGLKVEFVVNLGAIRTLGKIGQVQQNIKNLGYSLSPLDKDNYVLSTTCNLGLTETQIYDAVEKTLQKLCDLELESVKMLSSTNPNELLDRCLRSFGCVSYSQLMNPLELKSHLSNLILGANLKAVNLNEQQILNLAKLTLFATNEVLTQEELLTLAQQTKEIIKGGTND